MASAAKIIVNLTRGNLVCEHVVIADRARHRMRGLLGRRSLPAGEGVLLQPAPSIHTAFMRFPIDVVFLDRNLQVVKLVSDFPSWRIASALEARSALELAAGEIARRHVALGDQLVAVDPNVEPDEQTCSHRGAGNTNAEMHTGGDPSANGASSASGRSMRLSRGPKVLLVSSDRRFRSVAAALLSRRGVDVSVSERMSGVDELAHRLAVEVVVLDAGVLPTAATLQAARLESLHCVGVVVVSDVRTAQAAAMSVIPKWDSLDALADAIEHARLSRNGVER